MGPTTDEWLVYVDKQTNKCTMREVYLSPRDTSNEVFLVITNKITAMTLCNRINSSLEVEVKANPLLANL